MAAPERNCEVCIHHISGMCCKWTCEPETLKEHDRKVKEEIIKQIKEQEGNN